MFLSLPLGLQLAFCSNAATMRSSVAVVLLVGVAAYAPPSRPQLARPVARMPRASPQFGRGTVRMQLSVGEFFRFPLTARILRFLGVLPARRARPQHNAVHAPDAVPEYVLAAAEAQRLQEEAMRRAEERKIEQAREWAMRAISESKPKRAPPPASVVTLAPPAKVAAAAPSAPAIVPRAVPLAVPASVPVMTESEVAAVTASEVAAAIAAVPVTAEPTVVAIKPKTKPKKETMTDEDADDYVRRTNAWWFDWARRRARAERRAAYSD